MRFMHKRGGAALAVVVILGSCSSRERSSSDSSAGGTAAVPVAGATTAAPVAPAHGVGPRITAPVTELGIGPLRVGMTVAQARTALGQFEVPATTPQSGCDYAKTASLPRGVSVMVEDGIVVRIDVDTTSVATSEGARVGDSERRVLTLYGKRATISPHKYTDGHYLTIKSSSPGDTLHQVIFETNKGVVTNYRAGQLPQVAYVEGCS